MRVFDFKDYRKFLRAHLDQQSKKKRGQASRMAEAMQLHPSALSQILQGTRELSLEQSARLVEHLGLTTLESDYFLCLVNLGRAGSAGLREIYRRQLAQLQAQAEQLVNRVHRERVLSDDDKAIFYSQWYYSAISLLTSIEGCRTREEIAQRLKLPRPLVHQAIDFLLRSALCVEKDGQLSMGTRSTHIEASSPLASRHHANWRLKALENLDRLDSQQELVFTAPMTLSRSDVPRVREILMRTAEELRNLALKSGSEALFSLHMDWFELR